MPTLGNLGLRGLTANDRSQSDKQAIAQQNGSNLMVTPINLNMPSNRQYFQGLSDTNAIMQNTYQDMLQQYKDEYHIDRDRNRFIFIIKRREIKNDTRKSKHYSK